LCYISISDNRPTVTVIIGASQSSKIQFAKISIKAKKMYKNAKQYYDSKWLHFELKTKKDLSDIITLLAIKRPPKK